MSGIWLDTLATKEGDVERIAPLNRWRAPDAVSLLPGVDDIIPEPFLAFTSVPYQRANDELYARSIEDGLVLKFVRLQRASDDEILTFASEWGTLSIPGIVRQISVPAWIRQWATSEEVSSLSPPAQLGPKVICEPVADWRRAATLGRRLLRIAACLHSEDPIEAEERAALDEWQSLPVGARGIGKDAERSYAITGARYIGYVANGWVGATGVHPVALWGKGLAPEFSLSTGSLGAALGVQLLMAITSARGFATCSYCGELYTPRRKPTANSRRFCPNCQQEGIPERLAQRDRSARLKKKVASN